MSSALHVAMRVGHGFEAELSINNNSNFFGFNEWPYFVPGPDAMVSASGPPGLATSTYRIADT